MTMRTQSFSENLNLDLEAVVSVDEKDIHILLLTELAQWADLVW